MVDGIGVDGQLRMLSSRVLVVGAGGLGSPVLMYLAATGIGTLGVVDCDRVELSNLQRQVLHSTSSIGADKVDSAARRIRDLNPDVTVNVHGLRFSPANALELVEGYDVVVDATDSYGSRYLLSDACLVAGRPLVHGAVMRYEGTLSVLCDPGGPCYRCVFPRAPEPGTVLTPAEAGVLSPVPGVIGTLQAMEAIKLVTGHGRPLIGRLLIYDGLNSRFDEIRVDRRSDCSGCGVARTRIEESDPLYQF